MVADPVPSVFTGGTSWDPSSDAVQLVEVVEYAVFGLVMENIPISNTAPKKIVIAFNDCGRTLCYLFFATSYGKILNTMNVRTVNLGVRLRSIRE
ncbi:MAG: hypothetical protein HMLIMOIP_001293 [Candidatus Nitrosomirales archaeon]|jgi:hypothetical protein